MYVCMYRTCVSWSGPANSRASNAFELQNTVQCRVPQHHQSHNAELTAALLIKSEALVQCTLIILALYSAVLDSSSILLWSAYSLCKGCTVHFQYSNISLISLTSGGKWLRLASIIITSLQKEHSNHFVLWSTMVHHYPQVHWYTIQTTKFLKSYCVKLSCENCFVLHFQTSDIKVFQIRMK